MTETFALAGFFCNNKGHSFDGTRRDEYGRCPKCEAELRGKNLNKGEIDLNPGFENTFGIVRHPNSARFHELLKEIGELHDRKQQDYGRGDDPFANVRSSTAWGVPPWVGAMVRASDKMNRLQAYAEQGSLANEGVDDSLRDLAVYALIALVLFEQEAGK